MPIKRNVVTETLVVTNKVVTKCETLVDGGTIKRACANVFQIKSITCSSKAVVEVYGKHRLLPGDIVALEGIVVDATVKFHAINREHTVGSWKERSPRHPPHFIFFNDEHKQDVSLATSSTLFLILCH
jgi:hypothetical protein